MKNFKQILSIWFAVLISAACAMAQTETGQITGTVLDPTGASVAGATVAARSLATGVSRSTTAGDSGLYVLPNLLPGDYQVSVTAPGFSTTEERATVTVGAKIGLDLRLQLC